MQRRLRRAGPWGCCRPPARPSTRSAIFRGAAALFPSGCSRRPGICGRSNAKLARSESSMFTKSEQFYDAVYSWKKYDREAAKVRDLIGRHKRSDGNTLLDVACGTGRHIEYLRDGFAVEGLDLDPKML